MNSINYELICNNCGTCHKRFLPQYEEMPTDSEDSNGIHREKIEIFKCDCGNEILVHTEAFKESSFLSRIDGAKLIHTDQFDYSNTIKTIL